MENFKYHFWILHKTLVKDEIYTISQKSTHISFNISLSILKPHIPEHPFPLAGHDTIVIIASQCPHCTCHLYTFSELFLTTIIATLGKSHSSYSLRKLQYFSLTAPQPLSMCVCSQRSE